MKLLKLTIDLYQITNLPKKRHKLIRNNKIKKVIQSLKIFITLRQMEESQTSKIKQKISN